MSKNKRYRLQTDAQNSMDLLYLEYNGERVPGIQFVYSPSDIHELEALIGLLNKTDAECSVLDNQIDFLHNMNTMLDRQITIQAKHLEKIYKLIKNKDWDGLTALYMDTHQDYEEIV
ncbi:MAG: hypothetical protein J6M91_03700 [Methanobrevibacter sp.]|nr:hypothetical protein [Methanobrevibacter sp.]